MKACLVYEFAKETLLVVARHNVLHGLVRGVNQLLACLVGMFMF